MGIWHVPSDTVLTPHAGQWREWLRFLRHLGEMFLAMMLGMPLFGMPEQAFMRAIGYPHPTQQFPEVAAVVMAINMTIPMVAWMWYRGHGWERTGEMAAAMLVPAVALLALCLVGVIPHTALSGAIMIVMVPAMILVMLYRRAEMLTRG